MSAKDHLCLHQTGDGYTHMCLCHRIRNHDYTELTNQIEQPTLFDIFD